jgi:hypothetical protein
MVPDPKIIREWTLRIKLATKQKSLRDPGPFPSIDAKIRTSMIAIMNGELRSNVLEKTEEAERMNEDLSGRELMWMLLEYNKRDSAATSFTDLEDLASVTLHGGKLGKYWSAFKYLLRGFSKQPPDDVLEYLVWKQIRGCDLIKNEITIYKQKTTKTRARSRSTSSRPSSKTTSTD